MRPRREAVHSPPTSNEVKETSICTATPPHVLISQAQGQLYLYLRMRAKLLATAPSAGQITLFYRCILVRLIVMFCLFRRARIFVTIIQIHTLKVSS
jgi:hypothetical protein